MHWLELQGKDSRVIDVQVFGQVAVLLKITVESVKEPVLFGLSLTNWVGIVLHIGFLSGGFATPRNVKRIVETVDDVR